MTEAWRLLESGPADGPTNMATDEAILELVGEGESSPTLRFYEWRSPWVSLGSGQLGGDLDRAAVEQRGWGILRRASGGAAVLHQGQLGYALILPTNHPLWQGDLTASYERLAEPLRRALARLGIAATPASLAWRAQQKSGAPVLAARICFASLGPYELLVDGRKVVGNSQIRRRTGSIQHGVIQLVGGQTELADVLAGVTAPERAGLIRYLNEHIGPVRDDGDAITASDVRQQLARAIKAVFAVTLDTGQLTPSERERAATLVGEKYGNPEWTFRR